MYNIFTKDNKAFDSPIMKNQYALSIISNLLIIAINLYQYNEFDLNSNKIESNYGKFWQQFSIINL